MRCTTERACYQVEDLVSHSETATAAVGLTVTPPFDVQLRQRFLERRLD
jgi:hypothetical protein